MERQHIYFVNMYMNAQMRIAVLTGGGDCPGLNAVIEATVRRAALYGFEVLGFVDGYDGLMRGEAKPLTLEDVEGAYAVGGTMLGTSRRNPFKSEDGPKRVLENLRKLGVDALIVIGGDDTLGAAYKLSEMGVSVVGVPKTIDNDLPETDYCVGFQTAVEIAAEAISRLHTTAKSHRRVIVVEVMGRYAGWLTLMAGIAGGAHVILIPEKPFKIEDVCRVVEERERAGKRYTIIAVAEGAKPADVDKLITASKEKDEFGHVRLGGISKLLEEEIRERTGKETRSVILGHVQRGGPPNAFDRILGIRLGISAVDLVKEGKFGYAVVSKGGKIVPVKLENIINKPRYVPEELFELTEFFSTGGERG